MVLHHCLLREIVMKKLRWYAVVASHMAHFLNLRSTFVAAALNIFEGMHVQYSLSILYFEFFFKWWRIICSIHNIVICVPCIDMKLGMEQGDVYTFAALLFNNCCQAFFHYFCGWTQIAMSLLYYFRNII